MDPRASALADQVIQQVEEKMRETGKTKRDMAEGMGVSPGYISHLFLGRKRNMTLETLVKLAEAAGMSVEVVLS